MSDSVSRKALLKFLYANYEENKLSQAGKALDYVIKKIEAGAFPSIESEKEIESLKAITDKLADARHDLINEVDALKDKLFDQKAITELAVKGLKEIACLNVDNPYSAGTFARSALSEIEELKNATS